MLDQHTGRDVVVKVLQMRNRGPVYVSIPFTVLDEGLKYCAHKLSAFGQPYIGRSQLLGQAKHEVYDQEGQPIGSLVLRRITQQIMIGPRI